MDGSSNASGASARLILVNPKGIIAEYALRFEFSATNNGAEYEALIAGLKIDKELKVDRLQVYSNSQLVVRQISSSYEAQEKSMMKYLESEEPNFDLQQFQHPIDFKGRKYQSQPSL